MLMLLSLIACWISMLLSTDSPVVLVVLLEGQEVEVEELC